MVQRQPRPGSRRPGSRTANARRRLSEEGDHRQPRRSQRASQSPAPIVIGIFVLVGLVIGVIGWLNSEKVKQAANEEQAETSEGPFQGVPDETGPRSNNSPGASRAHLFPNPLAGNDLGRPIRSQNPVPNLLHNAQPLQRAQFLGFWPIDNPICCGLRRN